MPEANAFMERLRSRFFEERERFFSGSCGVRGPGSGDLATSGDLALTLERRLRLERRLSLERRRRLVGVAAHKVLSDDTIALRLARREVLDRLDRLVAPLGHLRGSGRACRKSTERSLNAIFLEAGASRIRESVVLYRVRKGR